MSGIFEPENHVLVQYIDIRITARLFHTTYRSYQAASIDQVRVYVWDQGARQELRTFCYSALQAFSMCPKA